MWIYSVIASKKGNFDQLLENFCFVFCTIHRTKTTVKTSQKGSLIFQ
jgi:hypothetical protein